MSINQPHLHASLSFALMLANGLSLASSPMGNCVKGTGAPVERVLTIVPFTGIALQGSMQVRLAQGNTQEVKVQAQSELIDLLETEVKNNIWSIRTSKCFTSDKPFIIFVTVPNIDRISVQGSGDVKSTTPVRTGPMQLSIQGSGDIEMVLSSGSITSEVQGSGDMLLRGTCEHLESTIQGSGDIDAGDLVSNSAVATIQGSGDVKVQVTGALEAHIQGSGSVEYKGKPATIDMKVSGSGEVKPAK